MPTRFRLLLVLAAAGAALLVAPAAQAACAFPKGDVFDQVEAAPVAFLGTAQRGPATDGGLLSPATFDVAYRLDHGKRTTEQVATDRIGDARAEDGLTIRPKERWMIVGRRGADGVVGANSCTPANARTDWGERVTWRVAGTSRHSPSTLSDTRGNPLRHASLPKMPKGVRNIEVWTSTAARLIHGGKRTKLKTKELFGGRNVVWDFAKAVPGDRVVVATRAGFWAAEVR